MDIEQTKAYYTGIKREDICGCPYCQNFIDEVRHSYPEAAAYLASVGVDIERPFEVLLPTDSADGYMDYHLVQYLIAGDVNDFQETKVGDITITISTCHPAATYKGAHFIIDAGVFHIKCRYDKYNFEE